MKHEQPGCAALLPPPPTPPKQVAAKALQPSIKIIAAEPTGRNDAADVAACKAAGQLVQVAKPRTICDGLEARLGSYTWPIVRDLVDDVVTVTEEEVVAAMQLVMERMKARRHDGLRLRLDTAGRGPRAPRPACCSPLLPRPAARPSTTHPCRPAPAPVPPAAPQVVVEPSGAAGVAAALSPQLRARHPQLRRVGVILCGGNIEWNRAAPGFWARWLEERDAPSA